MTDAAFLVLACVLRVVLVRSRLSWPFALLSFAVLVASGLPFIYAFSPSWHEELVASPLTIYVGEPAIVSGVPFVSLLVDLSRRRWAQTLILPVQALRGLAEVGVTDRRFGCRSARGSQPSLVGGASDRLVRVA